MHKKMIYRFFVFQTQIASTWTAKISSFKHVFCRNLAFCGCPSKKKNFCWGRRLPSGVSSNIPGFQLCGTKTLDGKGPLRVMHSISSLPLDKTSLPASKANKLQILSSSQLLKNESKAFRWGNRVCANFVMSSRVPAQVGSTLGGGVIMFVVAAVDIQLLWKGTPCWQCQSFRSSFLN